LMASLMAFIWCRFLPHYLWHPLNGRDIDGRIGAALWPRAKVRVPRGKVGESNPNGLHDHIE